MTARAGHQLAAGALTAVCGLTAAVALERHWSEPTRQEAMCDAIRGDLATAEDYLATLDRESTSEAVAVNAGAMNAGTLDQVAEQLVTVTDGGWPTPAIRDEVTDYTHALWQLRVALREQDNDRALQARLELIGDAEDIRFRCLEYDQ